MYRNYDNMLIYPDKSNEMTGKLCNSLNYEKMRSIRIV